jgi:crotonobetainyl-CoA:carnitine CoA-transferase CaiB-like acyl-CoA transferase
MNYPLPFDGIRVIEFAHFWSVPYGTMYLASQGADVIKVESVQRPDVWRANHTAPILGDHWMDRGLLWQATNLDKRDITLDASSDQGRALLKRLCEGADIFIENYASHVVEKQGLGYEDLKAINPGIIMVRAPSFGNEGPWKGYVGWGDVFEQVSGFATVTGYPDSRPQTPGGYMDPIVAMHLTTAIIAALEYRDRTGEGQLIEVPQSEVGMAMAGAILIADQFGYPPERPGNRAPGFAPQGVYRTGDADKTYIALSIRDDQEWQSLIAMINSPALNSLADLSLEQRHAHHDEIDAIILAWTLAHPANDLLAQLQSVRIPASRLLRPVDYNIEPQLVDREYYQELDHPLSGARLFPTFPMHFSYEESRKVHSRPAPMLGQHNEEILRGELGVTAAAYADLIATNVIGTEPLQA